MDERGKLLADRIHALFGGGYGSPCMTCRLTIPHPHHTEKPPMTFFPGTFSSSQWAVAGVVAACVALREVGLDPEAVEREIQKQEPLFHMRMWIDDGFGCCFEVETFLKIATKLLG